MWGEAVRSLPGCNEHALLLRFLGSTRTIATRIVFAVLVTVVIRVGHIIAAAFRRRIRQLTRIDLVTIGICYDILNRGNRVAAGG